MSINIAGFAQEFFSLNQICLHLFLNVTRRNLCTNHLVFPVTVDLPIKNSNVYSANHLEPDRSWYEVLENREK